MSGKLQYLSATIIKNPDVAEDLVQDAFVKLWNKRKELGAVRNLESYITTMVKNLSLDHLRKKKEVLNDKDELLDYKNEKYEDRSDEKEQVKLVEQLINELPETQRMVMYMKDIQEYSSEEIGKIIEMNQNAIRVNLSRARNKVRSELIKINSYEKVADR